MGTWGAAIFSDDFASDIKDNFILKMSSGISAQQATQQLLDENRDDLGDVDSYCVFWLALAQVQTNKGHLQKEVKGTALEIIDKEKDLERWTEDKKLLEERRIILQKLKMQLLAEQPPPKKFPKPWVRSTQMESGDLIVYTHSGGKKILMKVITIQEDYHGDRYPRVQIFNFFSEPAPHFSNWESLGIATKEMDPTLPMPPTRCFYITSYGKKDQEPWNKMKVVGKTEVSELNSVTGSFWWKDFEETVEIFLNLDINLSKRK
jgi:hypothetical protein